MTAPSISLTEQMLRRRPVIGAPVAHGASDHLKRTIGTFQLTMFGVGATVGTGIFFVLSAGGAGGRSGGDSSRSSSPGSPQASRPSVTPKWRRPCRFRVPRTRTPTPRSGELVAMGVAACLLLEYGVSTVGVGRRLERIPEQAVRQLVRSRRYRER